jgi:hypothetical protein
LSPAKTPSSVKIFELKAASSTWRERKKPAAIQYRLHFLCVFASWRGIAFEELKGDQGGVVSALNRQ